MKANEPRLDGISLDDEEGVKRILRDSVLGLWEVVNNLTRLRPTRHDRFCVTIFGSARAKPGTIAYEETKRVAAALSELGCDIITGGGPGLMQAANEGSASVSGAKPVCRDSNRAALRTRCESLRDTGIRASNLFYAIAPFRPRLRCLCCRSGRNRHRPGNDDGLATPSGGSSQEGPANPGWPHVARFD